MSIKEDIGPKQLIDEADTNGIAVTSVSDGHVFVFSRDFINEMLRKINNTRIDRFVLFVKNPKVEDNSRKN
jgi:hypothetical protein